MISYEPCPDLWCITTYFNPCHYRTRQENYARFGAPLREAGIPLLTVECAFGDDPFELAPGPDVLQVRCPHVLWQKERLINLAVGRLPADARKVAWLDDDILFTNPRWAVETAHLLDEWVVVQPFERVVRLKQGKWNADGDEYTVESFAAVTRRDPQTLHAGTFHAHGHTGFAWAARRGWLAQHGLYEAFLSGNADHYMAHVLAGDLSSPCMQNLRGISRTAALSRRVQRVAWLSRLRALIPQAWKKHIRRLPGMRRDLSAFWRHFERWARPAAEAVGGQVGYLNGEVLHLWHGEGANRGHGEGWLEMHRLGFDPAADLRVGPSGGLEWASDKPALRRWAAEFFARRKEDGG